MGRVLSQNFLRIVSTTALFSAALGLSVGQRSAESVSKSSTITQDKNGFAWMKQGIHPWNYSPSHTRCEAVARPVEESSWPNMKTHHGGDIAVTHAIFGLLLRQGAIESYNVYKRPDGDSSENQVVGIVKFGTQVDGHRGIVHGGIIALMVDDLLGFAFGALGVKKAFTANLSIDYRSPLPAGTEVQVAIQMEHREGRKLFWKFQMTSLDGKILFAEGSSLYIIPRSHA